MNLENPHLVRQYTPSIRQLRKIKPTHEILNQDSDPADYFLDSLGRNWFKIPEGRNAPGQMLFSRLIHPIVPVSDIVYKKTKKGKAFYSYHTPLANVENQKSSTEKRLWEKMFFLWVLKDLEKAEYGNISRKDYAHSWFDFETIPAFFMDHTVMHRTDSFFTEHLQNVFFPDNDKFSASEHQEEMSDLTIRRFDEWVRGKKNLNGLSYMKEILQTALVQWTDKVWVQAVIHKTVSETNLPLQDIMHFPASIICKSQECYTAHLQKRLVDRALNVLEIIETYERSSAR